MVIRIPNQRTAQGGYAALDDRMLVLDFQAGHPEAFVEIHRRYGGLARHVCQRFLPNQADADEALQETMIRVFQGLYHFNGRYALRPWIARIAKNVSLDILRGRARRPQTDDAVLAETLADPHDEADVIVERLVQRDTVLEVMAALPEAHRRALVMREIDGASHRDIARALDISPAQAKALLHRARGAFRKRWLEKMTGEGGLKAIAFLPLLWLAQVAGGVRRLGERAGQAVGHATQAAQAAAPEVVSNVVVSAAPAGAGLAERVLAAGMTLLVAGGVTVGAAKIVQDRTEPAQAEVAAAAAVVAEVAAAPSAVPEPEATATSGRETPTPLPDEPPVEPVVEEPAPVIEPSPSTDPVPQVDPSPTVEPSPEPSPTEEPPPPPPPEPPFYNFLFSSSPEFSGLCPCLMIASPTTTAITGADGFYEMRQVIDGRAVSDGADAYGLWLEFDASVSGGSGDLTADFYIDTVEGGWYAYRGSASVVSAVATEHGMDYTLQGAFDQQNASEAVTDEVPTSGSMTITLRVWDDGALALYEASVSLSA